MTDANDFKDASPRPWIHWDKHPDSIEIIEDKNGLLVSRIFSDSDEKRDRDNAKLIKAAVNAYDPEAKAAMEAELARLAKLAHDAEAAMARALEGMFHNNLCPLNPANDTNCDACGHSKRDHNIGCANVDGHGYLCICLGFQQSDARCSCGTSEATEMLTAALAAIQKEF